MFPIGRLCKRAVRFHYVQKANRPLLLLQQQLVYDSSLALRFLSVSPTSHIQSQCEEKDESVKTDVYYLVNSCGLSPESAIHACRRVRLVNLERSEAVVHLLKTQGFSLTQISGMVRRFPSLIVSNPEKTLLPKLNYIYSLGFSKADACLIFSSYPRIFSRSLDLHIIPIFDLLRDFAGTNNKAIETIKHKPYTLLTSSHKFAKTLEKVKTLGFSSSSSPMFVRAVTVMTTMSKSTWEKKVKIFQRWGWSLDETYQAFRKFSHCLAFSEEKINVGMDFFVNEAGVETSYIAQNSVLLGYSLEKRLIPRYTINQILLSRGLVKITRLTSLFGYSNKDFKKKFVIPYLEEAPELLDLYHANSSATSK